MQKHALLSGHELIEAQILPKEEWACDLVLVLFDPMIKRNLIVVAGLKVVGTTDSCNLMMDFEDWIVDTE